MRDRHGSSRESRGLPGAQIALAIRTGEAVPRAAALGRVEFVGRNLVTPEFKVDDGSRTELKANSFSAACNRTSTRNFPNTRQGFPRQRFLATPMFRIHSAPPARRAKRVLSG